MASKKEYDPYKDYTPGTYTESDVVKNAEKDANYWKGQDFKDLQLEDFKNSQQTTDVWNQYNNLKGPGDFNFAHQQGWDDIINKINNREQFTYDVNGDALYQQYKDQFITGGKMAMMDTMGQAAAMTGGYGNSYAQSVGQQAYQGHLQQLTDKIPELYSLALSKYQMEGDDLYKQHGLYTDLFNRDYGMHRDTVADYKDERSHLLDLWGKSHAVDVDKYTINRDNTVAENESYNANLANKQDLAWKVYTDLRDTEYGRWMDDETLKKLAIEVANSNIAQQKADDIAAAENTRQQDKWDLEKKQYDTDDSVVDFSGLTPNGNPNPNPNAEPTGDEFTGKTYDEAVKYIKDHGGVNAASLRTANEFTREKRMSGGVTIGGKKFTNYQEYLKAYIEWATT